MNKRTFDVLTAGELNVDIILNDIDSFPETGKEKIAGEMNFTMGSSSAIFACNLSSLGAKVSFTGRVGTDLFGDFIIDKLRAKGVDTSMIIRDKEHKTGATIILNYGEDRAMVTYPGAMAAFTLNDITSDILTTSRHLHFSSYYLQPGLKNDAGEMFKAAKENGLTTSFDMQWDPDEKWDMDYKTILPFVDVFLPNEQEVLSLTKQKDIVKAVEQLSPYANNIIVKMGNKGSTSYSNKEINVLKPFLNNDVVDAIGAGDSFNAGFIFKYIKEYSIAECQEFGNLMGAINTTAPGGVDAFTHFDDIMKTAKQKFGYNK